MKKKLLLIASIPFLFTANAYAALPADVTTDLATVKADVITLGGAVLLILVSIAGFRYLKRGV